MRRRSGSLSPSNLVRRGLVAISCLVLLLPHETVVLAQAAAPAGATDSTAVLLPPEELDSLVAPIALYPDPLLAQTLVAATYPLEIIQLQQWLRKNADLKDWALADAVATQPWDPSIQSMAAVPEVVNRLADDVQWTTNLGNAFLSQQKDVMDAVQRMRKKASDNGALVANEQQMVETKVVEQKTVIVVEPSDPEVIYVPSYSPTVVYGPPVYPYPPIYYPPYPPGAAFVTFSFGVMMGAAIWGGSCCYVGWGGNDIDINIDNNFNRVNNKNGGNRAGNTWTHDPQHRGGAPYSDRATANKYGGTARGDPQGTRQAGARQQPTAGQQPGARQQPSAGTRPTSPGESNRPSGGSAAGLAQPTSMDRSVNNADRIGSQSIPKSSPSKASGLGGNSGGYNGSSARANSARGASSMGSRGGGGRRR